MKNTKEEKLAMYREVVKQIKSLKDTGMVLFGRERSVDTFEVCCEKHGSDYVYLVEDYCMTKIPQIAAIVFRFLRGVDGY